MVSNGTVYRIKLKSSNEYWHCDGGADKLLSTRYQANDDFTRFIFEKQSDNSFKIYVKATGRHWHCDGGGDKILSTRYQPDDEFTRFFLEKQNDGSYKFRLKATNEYLYHKTSDKLIYGGNNRSDDSARFFLVQ